MPHYGPTKLTETFIRDLPFEGIAYAVRDTKVTGLFVAVNKTGKSYKVQRDLWRGRRGQRQLIKTVRHTLGTTEDLTLEQARLKAEDVIRQIKLGIDPNEPLAGQKAEGWTVDILFQEYADDLRARECSERTIEDTLARRDRYLAPGTLTKRRSWYAESISTGAAAYPLHRIVWCQVHPAGPKSRLIPPAHTNWWDGSWLHRHAS